MPEPVADRLREPEPERDGVGVVEPLSDSVRVLADVNDAHTDGSGDGETVTVTVVWLVSTVADPVTLTEWDGLCVIDVEIVCDVQPVVVGVNVTLVVRVTFPVGVIVTLTDEVVH